MKFSWGESADKLVIVRKALKLLFIDCGFRDQYQIHFGARQLSKQLSHFQVEHTYEEFDDTHSGIDYRLD